MVSELEQPHQQLLGESQTCILEQRVDGLQILSADTFVCHKVLYTGQVVPFINHGRGRL